MLGLLNCCLPEPLPFFSLCIYRLYMNQLLHPTAWSFKSAAERSLFPQQSQCPGAEHLKPEDRQPPKDAHPSWNPTNRGQRQELGNELKNGWQVSRPQTQFWAMMSSSPALELRLSGSNWASAWGSICTGLQHSLRKQRGDSHGKETPCIMLYSMNFCKCSTAPVEEAVYGLSLLLPEKKYERSSENPREMYLFQVVKIFCPT